MKKIFTFVLLVLPFYAFSQTPICNGVNTVDGVTIVNTAGKLSSTGVTISNITGNLPTAISGTNTTAAVTISSGQASDSTIATELTGAGYSWAVSNGNAANGYQGGTTLPNSSTIHFFLCNGGSGTTSFASTSLSPTCPTGYATYYRRIFSLNTNSSGALIAGTASEIFGGAYRFYLSTAVLDINGGTAGASPRTLFSLTVPSGIKVLPIFRFSTGSGVSMMYESPDEPDNVGTSYPWTTAPGWDLYFAGTTNTGVTWPTSTNLITNTSGQIAARGIGGTVTIYWVTRGFDDFRRN